MSENPFATPEVVSETPKAPQKAPGALTAILIICLVMGILGLLGSCIGAGGLAFQGQIQGMQQNVGDPAQQALQKEMQRIQNQQMIPNLIMIGLNFIVAPLLTIGAIGGLNRKPWGHKLLSIGLLGAIFYVLIRLVVTIIMQVMTMGPMSKAMEDAMAKGGGAEAQAAGMIGNAMQIGIIIGIVITVVWGLLLLGLYIWSWMYLRKDQVRNYFGVS